MENIFIALNRLLEQNKKMVLARIIRQVGSAPRSVGAKCLILEDHTIIGTIGGGLLEHQAVQKAAEVMEQGRSLILQYQLKGEEIARSEMLCGGEVDVFLEPIFPEDYEAKEIFNRIAALCEQGLKGTLATRILSGLSHDDPGMRALLEANGTVIGPVDALFGLDQKKYGSIKKSILLQKSSDAPLIFQEPVEPDAVVYIFGGGHISTFVVPLAKMAGFRVVVIDDRREFANKERFPGADEIMLIPFLEVFHHLEIGATSYIVIVTRGHTYDRDVLRMALQTKPAYIGMIGSKRKRDLIYQALRSEGVEQEKIDRVHSPIGLAIGAETPEEIAISIVAELIRERSRSQGGSRDGFQTV
ncbi:MAG: XdhC/CoxI family protein [Desulfobacteraceae bacterium]|nr:MAG: XdhC/CoxI family protein [Desulfobacteraceae bacterium]